MSKLGNTSPASSDEPSGRRVALIVGCNGSTDDVDITSLTSAERDAEEAAGSNRNTRGEPWLEGC